MRVPYFPGCTLNTTGKRFDNAVRASSAAVGLDLVELPEWNCCGATYPLIVDNMLELAAPAHVLVAAQAEGSTVTTACTTCYNVLKRTNKFIRNARGTMVLADEDAKIVKKNFLPYAR